MVLGFVCLAFLVYLVYNLLDFVLSFFVYFLFGVV